MSTALVPTNEQLPGRTHLGDRLEIAAIHSRLANMMQLPADVPADVIWAAAQIASAHHLDPFVGELYIMPTGAKKNEATGAWEQQYRAHVGVKGLRKIAREQANFTAKFAIMDDDEVQRYRRDMYHPDDVGVRCTLWRLDVARECKDAGIPYEPVIGVGFFRIKAQYHSSKKEWMPDNIPNTWTAQQVAEKRAEINAIKLAYDLVLDVADPAVMDDDALSYVEYKVRQREWDMALPAPREYVVEDDSDILFDAETPSRPQPPVDAAARENTPPASQTPRSERPVQPDVDMWDTPGGTASSPFVPDATSAAALNAVVPGANGGLPEPDEDGDVLFAKDTPWYATVLTGLQNGVAKFAAASLTYHRQGGPAKAQKYGWIAGLIDSVVEQGTGAKDGHKRVLAVLCQSDIGKDNPPSDFLTAKLLAKLATHVKNPDDPDGEKIPNPNYDQAVADAVVAIYRAAEAVATPSLFA